MDKDDTMKPLSEISAQTGVSVDTLRAWARTGRLNPARRKTVRGVLTWHTTASAVREALTKQPEKGRPVRLRT